MWKVVCLSTIPLKDFHLFKITKLIINFWFKKKLLIKIILNKYNFFNRITNHVICLTNVTYNFSCAIFTLQHILQSAQSSCVQLVDKRYLHVLFQPDHAPVHAGHSSLQYGRFHYNPLNPPNTFSHPHT